MHPNETLSRTARSQPVNDLPQPTLSEVLGKAIGILKDARNIRGSAESVEEKLRDALHGAVPRCNDVTGVPPDPIGLADIVAAIAEVVNDIGRVLGRIDGRLAPPETQGTNSR